MKEKERIKGKEGERREWKNVNVLTNHYLWRFTISGSVVSSMGQNGINGFFYSCLIWFNGCPSQTSPPTLFLVSSLFQFSFFSSFEWVWISFFVALDLHSLHFPLITIDYTCFWWERINWVKKKKKRRGREKKEKKSPEERMIIGEYDHLNKDWWEKTGSEAIDDEWLFLSSFFLLLLFFFH